MKLVSRNEFGQIFITDTNRPRIENIFKDLDVETRFDIIAIHNNKGKFELEHIENAFYHF